MIYLYSIQEAKRVFHVFHLLLFLQVSSSRILAYYIVERRRTPASTGVSNQMQMQPPTAAKKDGRYMSWYSPQSSFALYLK